MSTFSLHTWPCLLPREALATWKLLDLSCRAILSPWEHLCLKQPCLLECWLLHSQVLLNARSRVPTKSLLLLFNQFAFPGFFPIASRKMSASGAPTNVALPPSLIHFFHSLQQCMAVTTVKHGLWLWVLRDAKTSATSSRQFELDHFSSHPIYICFLTVFLPRFTYPAPISPPFWLDPSPAVTLSRKP